MKVLWLCNIVFPNIAQSLGIRREIGGGWMIGLLNMVKKIDDIELSVLSVSNDISENRNIIVDDVHYYIIPSSSQADVLEKRMSMIIDLKKYEVIHLFGSEYLSSYAMMRASNSLNLSDKLLLHIQGLVSVYAHHYVQGIPGFWVHLRTPRDLFQNISIICQQKDFFKRGRYEVETIKGVRHIGGRTQWDKACTHQINPQAKYYHHGEMLRESFYQSDWTIDQCERHSIFISQGNYPIKGLHHLFKALPFITPYFPDLKVYIAGYAPLKMESGLLSWLKRSSYGHYLARLIQKGELERHIRFTGPLNENQMKDRYLKSHIFVCSSNIENSPNSLGEAMMLGMPCISSDVGGVTDMLDHQTEGFVYPADEPYMLAHYIMLLFCDDKLSVSLGRAAKIHALSNHNKDRIRCQVETAYRAIAHKNDVAN